MSFRTRKLTLDTLAVVVGLLAVLLIRSGLIRSVPW